MNLLPAAVVASVLLWAFTTLAVWICLAPIWGLPVVIYLFALTFNWSYVITIGRRTFRLLKGR